MSEILLEVKGLSAGYVASPVVRDLDLTVKAGEVLSILGPNGAGKTTTLLAISGMLPRMSGSVTVAGQEIHSGRPRPTVKAGLSYVPDDRALFRTLTVAENLKLAAKDKAGVDEVYDLFPRLTERLNVQAGLLSGGEQQQLAIGRALVQRPRVLLIDELSMGLAPVIVEALLPVLRRVADETGAGVVLVEQHVQLALSISDTAMVLAHGEVALTGTGADLIAHPKKIEAAYLGESSAA
ncbi:ABC transporter ATP-binding protein [Nocardioides sp. Iso805N]|uniref:ABC transporter ATP-binding protein n=1 Tax=Nocardioides sp. Iso805N TaxID=1283287 RepID=UPI00036A2503|nr:ABC transporter ATP-binding protein [Nocardioides sp. Iso805N]